MVDINFFLGPIVLEEKYGDAVMIIFIF